MKNIFWLLAFSMGILGFSACKKLDFQTIPSNYGETSDSAATGILDTSNMSLPDYSRLTQARIFPGLVSSDEHRIEDSAIIIDRQYKYVSTEKSKTQVFPSPLNSVGLYAPPGEPIKIVVPDGVDGLEAQIGAWTDDLSSKSNAKRDNIIYMKKQLFPGVNYVRNPYGGTLYITSVVAAATDVTVRVSGAVREPDFVLGETSDADWVKAINSSNVPWFELRSKRVIFTLPRD